MQNVCLAKDSAGKKISDERLDHGGEKVVGKEVKYGLNIWVRSAKQALNDGTTL